MGVRVDPAFTSRFPGGATHRIVCPRRLVGLQKMEASNNAINGTSAAGGTFPGFLPVIAESSRTARPVSAIRLRPTETHLFPDFPGQPPDQHETEDDAGVPHQNVAQVGHRAHDVVDGISGDGRTGSSEEAGNGGA